MKLSDFDYNLDESLIAQLPSQKRENSRLMHLLHKNNIFEHKHFYDIVDLLDENDFLVLNDTKVFPARIFAKKVTGANIEIFLLKEYAPKHWEVLLKPAKRVKLGDILTASDRLQIKLLEKDMAQSLKKLKKANESECSKYFDKKRDLVVGSAPTDILTQIFGLGICSWAVSRAEKEDRVQTLVTKGLPIITGLGSSLVFSALLFPAGPSLIAGVGVSAVTGVVCHLINKYIFGNHDDEIANNQNTTQNNSINNQTNPANPQSQLKGVIYA